MLFLCRTMIHDLFFLICQILKWNIGPNSHLPAHIRHQRPHETVPGSHRPIINRQCIIRHQCIKIHCPHTSRTATPLTGPLGVECQFLRGRCIKMRSTFRADQLRTSRYSKSWFQIMTIGTAMTGKSGIHQPQTVQKFCSCSKCTADSRHSRSLVKCQCCRNMQHLIYLRLCSTCHSPSGIRGQRFQISSGTLRIEHTQSQRRFSRAGDTRDSHDLVQWNIHIYIFQIVHLRTPHLNAGWCC